MDTNLVQIALQNYGVIIAVVLFAGAVIGGKWVQYLKWVSETTFFAFDQAEKLGVAHGLTGNEKLRHYLEVYKAAYEKRFGSKPTGDELIKVQGIAAELAEKEKVHRLTDPS